MEPGERAAAGDAEGAVDAVLSRIGQAVMLHHGGDREEARGRFLALWAEIGEDGDPLHRCTLAHYLADTQEEPADELAWDLRALSAAEEMTDGPSAVPDGPPEVRGFFPSLHLNLAADYVKLGRREAARGTPPPGPRHGGRARRRSVRGGGPRGDGPPRKGTVHGRRTPRGPAETPPRVLNGRAGQSVTRARMRARARVVGSASPYARARPRR